LRSQQNTVDQWNSLPHSLTLTADVHDNNF